MSKRRKPSKPRTIKDPAEHARLNPGDGPSQDTLNQPDVFERPESMREGNRRIERFDAFALMHARAPEGTDAEREARKDLGVALRYVRRYQSEIARYHRAAGSPQTGVVVDFGRPDSELANIAAGERLRAVETHMGAHSTRIMRALCENEIGTSGKKWRAIIESVTGERNPHAQAALVRAAMHNVAGAYHTVDDAKPKRKAG